MRLLFVHGINQQGKSANIIREQWEGALRAVYGAHGPDRLDGFTRIEAAFYGDRLDELSSVRVADQAIALGAEEAVDDFDEFAVAALEDMAAKLGISHAEIEALAATTAVPQGAGPHKLWLKAIARAIEKYSPAHGTIALRLLGQAHAYIRNQHVHDEINALVRPLFEDDEPAVIISHSLGTIVSYSLLREFASKGRPRQSPLWMTLGSPLGIDSVRRGFSPPRVLPANVGRWFNGADPEDFVALYPSLSAEDYGPDVENHPDFENGEENPHDSLKYLSDPRVAEAITEALDAHA